MSTNWNKGAEKWRALTNAQRNYIIASVDRIEPVSPMIAEAIEAALELLREDVGSAAAEPEAKTVRAVVVKVDCKVCKGTGRCAGDRVGTTERCPICSGSGGVNDSIPLSLLHDLLMGNLR